jgi:osmotically-inducible protein OsmY
MKHQLRHGIRQARAFAPIVAARNIVVSVKHGAFTLTGDVPSPNDKWHAENIVKRAALS